VNLYDPLAIIALVVAIASLAFIVLEKGEDLPLRYRESEETLRRKKEIDLKLRAQARSELKKFVQSLMKIGDEEANEEEDLDKLVELGQSAYYARSLSERMLEDMTKYMGSALGMLCVTLVAFFVTLYMGVSASNLADVNSFLPFFSLAVLTFFALVMTIRQLQKHYSLREKFVRLGESPNLENCWKIGEELRNEGV
jgi:hypothetical protein